MATEGIRISWSGFANSWSTVRACADTGVRARFLVGRFERGSADVGMLSGPSPDMVGVVGVLGGFGWFGGVFFSVSGNYLLGS